MMPLPLLHRAIVVSMQREDERLERFDENDPAFAASREQIARWAATCSLTQNPEMPPSLRNRAADNWRVLLAIADDLGHGAGVTLLADIRIVFQALGVDRLASASLVEGLLRLDDRMWGDWRGPNDDRPPLGDIPPARALPRAVRARKRTSGRRCEGVAKAASSPSLARSKPLQSRQYHPLNDVLLRPV
jgi:hypothetical protein